MSSSAGGVFIPGDPPPSTNQNLINPIINAAPVTSGGNLTLAAALHDHRPVVINAAAGATVTLPPATGSGAVFMVWIGTTLTSGTFALKVANSSDYMRGAAYTVGAAAGSFLTANSGTVATESDTITFNRSTTGLGTIGDYVEAIDIAANVWSVECEYASSGTAATPFSASV